MWHSAQRLSRSHPRPAGGGRGWSAALALLTALTAGCFENPAPGPHQAGFPRSEGDPARVFPRDDAPPQADSTAYAPRADRRPPPPATTAAAPQPELRLPALAPIAHGEGFQTERDLFGYAPGFVPNAVTFGRHNRPWMRTISHDVVGRQASLQTLRDGRWVQFDLAGILGGHLPARQVFRVGRNAELRVAFDPLGGVYTLVEIPGSHALLLFSPDEGRSWQVHRVPGAWHRLEFDSGGREVEAPPAILSWDGTGRRELRLTLPVRGRDNRLHVPPPVVVAHEALGASREGGGANQVITRDGRSHVVWAGAEAAGGRSGTPIYAATYDHATGQTSRPVLLGLGQGMTASPDSHCNPAMVMDSEGRLHVVIGSHHRAPQYTRALEPHSTSSWSPPTAFGTSHYEDHPRYTYISLVIDPQDVLHMVARSVGEGWRFNLAHLSRAPGGEWSDEQVLVTPGRPYYHNWFHKLNIDRNGRLYVSYLYYTDEMTEAEAAAYQQRWRGVTLTRGAPSTGDRFRWQGLKDHDPALLTSSDGGRTWRLATTEDFQETPR